MPYIIGAIALVLIASGSYLFLSGDNQMTETSESATTARTEETTEITDTTVAAEAEVDTSLPEATEPSVEEYAVTTTYFTPARAEYQMDVTLAVDNDVITDANIAYSQGAESDPNAQRFEAAYKEEVIGANINELSLSRVGGASLTTEAFNNAVADIRAQI